MLFLTLYMLAMVLPGAALTFALRLNGCRGAMSIALSLSVLVLALMLGRIVALGPQGFGMLLIGLYMLIAAGTVLAWWCKPPVAEPAVPGSVWEGLWVMPVLTLGAVAGYVHWAGPYMEVPSDAWWHMARMQEGLEMVVDGSIGSVNSLSDIFDKKARYWHTLVAWFLHISDTGLEPGLHHLSMANTLLFCAGVYSFSLFVFRNIVEHNWTRHWIAAASVFFFVTHFGISVFSYVRYYIYAPTVLNYIVYLAAVACILMFIRRGRDAWRYVAAAAILSMIASLVHTQEALFIAVMLGAVILAETLRVCFQDPTDPALHAQEGADRLRWRVTTLLAVVVVSYLSIHAWAYLELVRHDPLKHGRMADIRHYVPFLQNLYILRPEFQFYQVITIWGVLVYTLFIFRAKQFIQSPYLIAGMAIPVLTVFNPVFTDFFLRFSWPEVLWRMCYMIPLPFVGAFFLVRSVAGVSRGSGAVRKSASLATAAALVVLLLPISSTYFISPHSKIYTLAPVEAGNDHRNWQDLLNFMNYEERARVITDPVTGYVVNGLTRHRYSGHKFHGSGALRVDKETYTPAELGDRHGALVVINRRDGAISETGRYGGHWPADVLHVSGYYSPEFRRFVTGRPDMFEPLWERDRIAVYRIVDTGDSGPGAEPDNIR